MGSIPHTIRWVGGSRVSFIANLFRGNNDPPAFRRPGDPTEEELADARRRQTADGRPQAPGGGFRGLGAANSSGSSLLGGG